MITPSTSAPVTKPKRMVMTPLWLLGIFVSLTESIAGIAAFKSEGYIQTALAIFVCVFPFVILLGFFYILWERPFHFYPPPEGAGVDDTVKYLAAVAQAKQNASSDVSSTEAASANASAIISPINKEPQLIDDKEKPIEKAEQDLEFKMFDSYVNKDREAGDKLFNKLLESETDAVRKDIHRIWRSYLLFTFLGVGTSLTEIIRFTKSSELDVKLDALLFSGRCYANIKDYANAINYFTALVDSSPLAKKPGCIASLASVYADDNQVEKAISVLSEAIGRYPDSEAQAVLYSKLASIYESEGKQELRALAAEKAIQHRPTDDNLRFAAGHAFSNAGLTALSIFHYESLIDLKGDHAAALNNLGVEYQNMGLPIMAAQRYRKAFDFQESLAGANLAYLLIRVGFAKEAQEILEKAQTMKEPHENVSSAIVALSENTKSENEKRKDAMKIGRDLQRFLRQYAEAYFLESKIQFSGTWAANNETSLQVTGTGASISAQWKQGNIIFKLTGIVVNRAAKIEVTAHAEKPEDFSLLLALPKTQKGYAFLASDRSKLSWVLMEADKPSFRVFRSTATQPTLSVEN